VFLCLRESEGRKKRVRYSLATDGYSMCLGMQFYCEKFVKARIKGKAYQRRKRLHMLSDLTFSAKYPEVKTAAEDDEGWRVTSKNKTP